MLPIHSLLILSYLLLLPWTSTAEQFTIMSSSSTGCPKEPCHTLTDVVQSPSQYFASNTIITLLPGHHQTNVSTNLTVLIEDVRNISLIGSDPSNSESRSVVLCKGSLGFSFINVTILKVAKLHFSFCGAYFPSSFTVEENFLGSSYFKKYVSKTTFYFLQTHNVTISEVAISNSSGAGLLGINMFGHSNISQTTFSGNKPNCILIFVDIPSTSQINQPTLLTIVNSQMMFGFTSRWSRVAGLTITLAQAAYNVHVHMHNIIIRYSNFDVFIDKWMCHCSVFQATQIAGTGNKNTLAVKLNTGGSPLPSCNCSEPAEEEYTVHISDSWFVGMGITVTSFVDNCDARIKLENITVQNTDSTALLIIRMLSIMLQDVSISYSRGIKITKSNITIHGTFLFKHNIRVISIVLLRSSVTSFHGVVKFVENKAKYGAVILAINSTIKFQLTAELAGNEGTQGGAIALYDNSQLIIGKQSNITFLKNHAQTYGGAVSAYDSDIVVSMKARMIFTENDGYDGGALALHNTAALILKLHSRITFRRNHAQHYGGALYVEDPKPRVQVYVGKIRCFFQPPPQIIGHNNYLSGMFVPRIVFQNNTAGIAGGSLFGGWLDWCAIKGASGVRSFKAMFHFQEPQWQSSVICSNPTRVCVCNHDIYDCNITKYNVTAYPGETFQIPAVTVGQMFGAIPFTVQTKFIQGNSSRPPQMKPLQRTQDVRRTCTNLTYTIMSSHQVEEMVLTVEKLDTRLPAGYFVRNRQVEKIKLVFKDLHVYISLRPCPLGFVLYSSACICHPQLQQHGINCNIDSQTVSRQSSMWINATCVNRSQNGIIVHEHCPFDYCKPESFELNLEDPDEQCAFHRSGILCGACQRNLSQVFGTSRCRECSSLWALLWVPAIALTGIALVVLLIVLNLTVSVGAINGLIFYTNIVRANQATFFPPNTTNSFLSWFIAWINLDLGIETCFYNGLNAYVKTWLQFVFPLYIWVLVAIIIVSSYYSTTAAKLSGRNAVQVLATLVLLSYAKLLRVIITVFQPTELVYPDTSVRKVWLYDGNVDYFKGRHIPLFIAALLLLLISLPYTFILIFIQHLQHISSYRVLLWVQKLKPLFDAYTGPYKDRHRYWTGLLLLVRIILLLVFSMNARGSADINLLAIILTVLSLFTHTVIAGSVYKTWSLNVLEYSFFLNLGILVSATYYTTVSGQGQTAVAYTSVSVAFAKFILIIVFHTLTKIKPSHYCNCLSASRIKIKLSQLRCVLRKLCCKRKRPRQTGQQRVSHASVELRESLLE